MGVFMAPFIMENIIIGLIATCIFVFILHNYCKFLKSKIKDSNAQNKEWDL